VRPVAAWKTRVWVAQGRLGEALGWAREQGLFVDDDLSYLREFQHLTLARVLLAHHQHDHTSSAPLQALGLLERLQYAAEAGGRMGSVIESLVLQALAREALGDRQAALVPLERALTLAEPEGYVRLFVDEGPPLAALVEGMKAEGGRLKEYRHELLAAFGGQDVMPPSAVILQPLLEPLSQRELEVLRLLRTELSGPEIARELVIALTTLRTHTKRIYSKLNVESRRAAVKRATELGLI
jgi:LuxR family maltose regulon positive regulatory protein